MTTSAPRAASAGEAATRAPSSLANASARAFVRFQTVRENGGFARCRAIGAPMAPSPRKETFTAFTMFAAEDNGLQ
jgi:hypothetical protein